MPSDKTKNEQIRDEYVDKRKRYKKKTVAALCGTALIAVLVMILLGAFAFRVKNVEIEGESIYDVESLCNAGEFSTGDSLFLVNRRKVARNIVSNLAYVESVTVRKKLPCTLVLDIKSAYDSFAVDMGSYGYVIFSAGGKIVSAGRLALPEGCTRVIGLDAVNDGQGERICEEGSEKFKLFSDFISDCAGQGLIDFSEIDISDPYNITATYKGRVKLIFGSSARLAVKAAGAVEIIKRDYELSENQYAEIDISDPERAYGKNVTAPESAAQPIPVSTDPAAAGAAVPETTGDQLLSAEG